jgi:uncharacterized NAD(P)/FAD-binding protein YdhS
MPIPRVVIVGGGYSGAATAVQLARALRDAVSITIVEPEWEVGRGLAYSTLDPDHRLNGPLDNHVVDPAAPDEMERWCEANRILHRDVEAVASNGVTYLRRWDFGTFVRDAVRATPSIRHHRGLATTLREADGAFEVATEGGARIAADLVVIATGNGRSQLPRVFAPLADHPGIVANPFDAARMRRIPSTARVFLVGSGLTALDAISTLLRARHRGRITAFSRHGVLPRPPRERMAPVTDLFDRIERDIPAYIEAVLARGGSLALTRALRRRIAEGRERGEDWQIAFDELRNAVWRFWPRLAVADRRRFLRHMRLWYDAHRFRTPPQNAAMALEAQRAGQLAYPTGRIREARAIGTGEIGVRWVDAAGAKVDEHFHTVINCSGLDHACGARTNPFLADLVAQGLVRVDPTGIGFEVDGRCRAIGRDGTISRRLRIVGPPTAGSHGDPLGVPFIAPQIRRMVPGVVEELSTRASLTAPDAA